VGFFLEEAIKREWNVYGTEFTDKAIDMCTAKGIKMFRGELDEIDFSGLKFDVITSIEVLEHLSNPVEHLNAARKLLRPGGIIYITTPNIKSFNSRILRNKWNGLSYPEHLCYYSKKSLSRAMKESGFKKVSLRTEGISPERLVTSMENKKVDHSSATTRDELLRQRLESSIFLKLLKRFTNSVLNILSLGESLKAVYKRPPE
jgi:2-polyprenyl-3-methyl-5-hydroxy-6-metoxy-1,4-benzoquinol methylase